MSVSNPTSARADFAHWRDLVGDNFYDSDPHLDSLLRLYGRQQAADALRAFGGIAATNLDRLARETNRDEHLPRLRSDDPYGDAIEEVVFHPGYHEMGRHIYATGCMSRYADKGREFETLGFEYLYSHNGEAGHACPLACTAGLIKILQRSDSPKAGEWLDRLYDPNYDTHFHGSQFLTEVQGGSDVGANAVTATDNGDGTSNLTGEKWFCSVIDAQLFLVTARPDNAPEGTRGVHAYVVPRSLDGRVNGFTIKRLKYKLGTRSMASAEIDLHGAIAWPVGDFRTVVNVVLNTSRLYNAVCSAGTMQRAWLEASGYAKARQAFGQPILQFPAVARTIAQLKVEAYAARASTFFLADLADQIATGIADETGPERFRFLVNLNKYWTSTVSTSMVRDAIEILGGNGAIEEFTVLPRLLRDAIVCEAWEGGHNVLCAQVLRDAQRIHLHQSTFDWFTELDPGSPQLAHAIALWHQVLEMPAHRASLHVRDAADALRHGVQLALLRREANHPDADPSLLAVVDYLSATTTPGWTPAADADFGARINRLVGAP